MTSLSDFMPPQAVYTLIQADGQIVRASLPKRSDWEVGDVVKIEEAVVLLNLVE